MQPGNDDKADSKGLSTVPYIWASSAKPLPHLQVDYPMLKYWKKKVWKMFVRTRKDTSEVETKGFSHGAARSSKGENVMMLMGYPLMATSLLGCGILLGPFGEVSTSMGSHPKHGDKQLRKYGMNIARKWRASTLYSASVTTTGRPMCWLQRYIHNGTGPTTRG